MAITDIYNAVIEIDPDRAVEMVNSELKAGTDVVEILNKGLIAPMDEVGDRFAAGDLFIPEMLGAATVMKAGLQIIKPYLIAQKTESKGVVVVGTVQGDLHDIGKNLVAMMLEGAGFDVLDLGVDVEVDEFIRAARENNADFVGVSALLTTTLPAMRTTVSALKQARLKAKIIVGGAPVTQAFAEEIGADGYARDAVGAVELARKS